MDSIINVISPIFWGLLLLSVLVFVHEGGHFLAARACGVRVTEFFLGMPCRFNLHHVSKRIGTKFGVTPILLGGYAAICGMDPTKAPRAAQVLAFIHRRGTVSAWDVHEELGIDVDELSDAVYLLQDWGSITCVAGDLPEDHPGKAEYDYTLASVPRDAKGNTLLDGRAFDRAGATQAGMPWEPPMGEDAFFEQERSRTYLGQGFWKRAFMLIAGIAVNIASGFLLVIMVYSVLGFSVPMNINEIGSVEPNSPAAEAGLESGDRILSVNGEPVEDWTGIYDAVKAHEPGAALTVVYAEDGEKELSTEVVVGEGSVIGINVKEEIVRLNPLDSCRVAIDNIVLTAQSVMSLLNPQHTMDILENSTSVVGISVMSAEAAAAGPATFLNFAALISFSLGFMNLLPIPPLDGGKLVIEVIQAVTRREVSLKVQNIVSIAGVVLFGALFIYMLRADILRFFL